jgi:DNA repair protein RecN (Recombination protein N)
LIYETLYAADDSVADRIAAMLKLLEQLASFDPGLQAQVSELQDAAHAVSDVGRHVGDYAQGIDHDPRRLAEVRARLDVIFRLKRKYGPELADVLATAHGVRTELAELGDSDHDLELLRQRIEATEKELEQEAARLSALRQKGATQLAAFVCETLPELGLVSATFEVALRAHGEMGSGGAESVEFLVSMNVGFDAMPLARIASGGELSRVMLALKSILAEVDRVPVLVFDEIDAGIGGVVASAVAKKLANIAERHQVFVVTHLAQVASRARGHLLVEKAQDLLGTTAAVTLLEGEARVHEIARMLGGDPESATSREHARELLGI